MVEMAILPILVIVSADVSGAGGVFGIQLLFRLRPGKLRITAQQARQAFAPGGVDKNMEGVFALLKNALASPSHNYAISNIGSLFNDPESHLGGNIRIKTLGQRAQM